MRRILDCQPSNFHTTYPAIVGKVLTDLRSEQSIHQKDLATKVGITQATWSRIESGQTSVTLDHLRAAARALNVTPSHILAIADQTEIEASFQGISVLPKGAAELPAGLVLVAGAALGIFVTYAMMKAARS